MPQVPADKLEAVYAYTDKSRSSASKQSTHSFTHAAPTSTLPPVLLVSVKVLPPT
jgi:hypothetical protein